MNGKRVFILGAGFSCNAGIVMQDGFRELLTRCSSSVYDTFERTLDEIITKQIQLFLKTVFCWNEGDTVPELEDIFTYIDLSINSLHNLGKDYFTAKLVAIRRFLIYKLFTILDEKYEASSAINDFIANISNGDSHFSQSSFISLNWDIVLEKHLSLYSDCFIDYGIDAKKVLLSPSKIEIDTANNGNHNINVAKVHGSSNWIYCNNCKKIFYASEKKLAKSKYAGIYLNDIKLLENHDTTESFKMKIREINNAKECPLCKSPSIESHIATFSFKKTFQTFAFLNSWQNAENMLNDADEWVFIGYSMPNADFEFKHMLKSVQIRMSQPKAIKVVVYEDSHAEQRYNTIFGKQNVRSFQHGLVEYNTYLKRIIANN
jgi:hypothetical protein